MSAQRRPATKRDTSGSRRTTGGARQGGANGRPETGKRAGASAAVDSVEAGGAAVAAVPSTRNAASSPPASKPAKPIASKTKEPESKTSALAERGGRVRKIFDDTRAEMKKITWPDRETTRNLTIVVIGISIVLGILLGGIDYVLFQIFEALP